MRASTVAADVPARDDAPARILPRDSQSLAVRWALEASARGMSFKELMTEDERQLPVPLERPASPLLFPLPDRADSPLSVAF